MSPALLGIGRRLKHTFLDLRPDFRCPWPRKTYLLYTEMGAVGHAERVGRELETLGG